MLRQLDHAYAAGPGHVVLVVDVCENDAGNKAFLLAQGYMPAQQFHLLKNPAHENDPWYYVNELTDPLHTPEYTFSMDSLKRLQYQEKMSKLSHSRKILERMICYTGVCKKEILMYND